MYYVVLLHCILIRQMLWLLCITVPKAVNVKGCFNVPNLPNSSKNILPQKMFQGCILNTFNLKFRSTYKEEELNRDIHSSCSSSASLADLSWPMSDKGTQYFLPFQMLVCECLPVCVCLWPPKHVHTQLKKKDIKKPSETFSGLKLQESLCVCVT